MERSEVRTFIESGVTALNPSLPFGSGRISEFDSERSHTYPMVWSESLQCTIVLMDNGTPVNAWAVKLHIAKRDKTDSTAQQYEDIIDEADLIAQQLVKKYNAIIDGYSKSWITSISRVPFIKSHADCLTGVLLSFTLNSVDETNLC
jgi:hypothetical protein